MTDTTDPAVGLREALGDIRYETLAILADPRKDATPEQDLAERVDAIARAALAATPEPQFDPEHPDPESYIAGFSDARAARPETPASGAPDEVVCHQHGGWHHHGGFEHSYRPFETGDDHARRKHPVADHMHAAAPSPDPETPASVGLLEALEWAREREAEVRAESDWYGSGPYANAFRDEFIPKLEALAAALAATPTASPTEDSDD